MKAQPTAAGLRHGAARPGPVPASPAAPGEGGEPAWFAAPGEGGEPASVRVAEARSRARDRRDAQRQAMRPLGLLFIAVVVITSAQAQPAPSLRGTGLAVTLVLVAYAAAVALAISVRWARRGPAAQVIAASLIGGCGVALAVLQPHGPVEIAPSMGVWIAAVRLSPAPAAAVSGVITAALAVSVGLTGHPPAQSAITATLVCLLLAVTGQFLRRGRESQDRTELLMAELEDAREAEAEWPGHPRSVTRSERWWSGPRGARELVGLSCHSPCAW